jgi:epoxyqueuosine reductase
LACPWNKFAQATALPDFAERNGMGGSSLLELWSWTAIDFEHRHEGSAIRRIGYSRWRRNLAVAMGNALRSEKTTPELKTALRNALQAGQGADDVLVQEHIDWALEAPFTG